MHIFSCPYPAHLPPGSSVYSTIMLSFSPSQKSFFIYVLVATQWGCILRCCGDKFTLYFCFTVASMRLSLWVPPACLCFKRCVLRVPGIVFMFNSCRSSGCLCQVDSSSSSGCLELKPRQEMWTGRSVWSEIYQPPNSLWGFTVGLPVNHSCQLH